MNDYVKNIIEAVKERERKIKEKKQKELELQKQREIQDEMDREMKEALSAKNNANNISGKEMPESVQSNAGNPYEPYIKQDHAISGDDTGSVNASSNNNVISPEKDPSGMVDLGNYFTARSSSDNQYPDPDASSQIQTVKDNQNPNQASVQNNQSQINTTPADYVTTDLKENIPDLNLDSYIRRVPDFPKKGILFYDVTTLMKDTVAFRQSIRLLAQRYKGRGIDVIVGVESRGFIIGSALAYEIGCGFVPARKPGKLPSKTVRAEYTLEYGTDAIEIHKDSITQGQTILLVDDLIATGGTIRAAASLVEHLGGNIHEIAFLIDLVNLHDNLPYPSFSLLKYKVDE